MLCLFDSAVDTFGVPNQLPPLLEEPWSPLWMSGPVIWRRCPKLGSELILFYLSRDLKPTTVLSFIFDYLLSLIPFHLSLIKTLSNLKNETKQNTKLSPWLLVGRVGLHPRLIYRQSRDAIYDYWNEKNGAYIGFEDGQWRIWEWWYHHFEWERGKRGISKLNSHLTYQEVNNVSSW